MSAYLWAILFIAISASGSEIKLNETINSKNSTWKAAPDSVIPDIPLSKLQHLGRVLPPKKGDDFERKTFEQRADFPIPESFDSREHWPKCAEVMNHIRDQGDCGACWAFSSASVMSDRLCIHSNGKILVNVSAQHPLTCSGRRNGCDGGNPLSAFDLWYKRGVVTGGEYGSENGCKSYTFDTCSHVSGYCGAEAHKTSEKVQCTEEPLLETPKCEETCDESSNLTFSEELTKGDKKPYTFYGGKNMQMEILKNGPIAAVFTVYQDFLCYKSGVYQNLGGGEVYGHAVRIIGWGVESGTNYWLVANSWGKDWGDNGFFKILRGQNECGIEVFGVAALPKKKQTS